MNTITKFQTGDFTKDDCLIDGDFTPEFIEFLKTDFVGRMYLNGFIRESKEDFVNEVIGMKKPNGIDSFRNFMKPYVDKFEKETGYKYNNAESEWRHCNDIALFRSTLKFDRGSSMCMMTVFEDRCSNRVNIDVFLKNENGGIRHWSHIDNCGCHAMLDDYFDKIISFCK